MQGGQLGTGPCWKEPITGLRDLSLLPKTFWGISSQQSRKAEAWRVNRAEQSRNWWTPQEVFEWFQERDETDTQEKRARV